MNEIFDAAALVRLLNDLAGVAGGIAAPDVAEWLAAYIPGPLGQSGRWAANLSGIAWAGASLVDLLKWLGEGRTSLPAALPAPKPAAALPAANDLDGQLALWRKIQGRATD